MKYIISGASGKMGRSLAKLAGEHTVVAGVCRSDYRADFPIYRDFSDIDEDFDVIIDFSVAANAQGVIEFARRKNKPLVIGTTALSAADEGALAELANFVPVLYSHNTALGVNIFLDILEYAAGKLKEYDIEIIEKHDRAKRDAPSGTSKMVVAALQNGSTKTYDVKNGRCGESPRAANELGVHSIRAGRLGSEHYVSFIGSDETIEINHYTPNYDIYAHGAIKAADILIAMSAGLYNMKDIIARRN